MYSMRQGAHNLGVLSELFIYYLYLFITKLALILLWMDPLLPLPGRGLDQAVPGAFGVKVWCDLDI
jgi:hypothetical protein